MNSPSTKARKNQTKTSIRKAQSIQSSSTFLIQITDAASNYMLKVDSKNTRKTSVDNYQLNGTMLRFGLLPISKMYFTKCFKKFPEFIYNRWTINVGKFG